MVHFNTVLAVSSLLALSSALSRVPTGNSPPQLVARSLEERDTCSGTCAQCFGSGYTLCPSSSIFCYKPGDADYGLDSCPYSSSSGSDSASASTDTYTSSYPTSTGSAGDSDFCSEKGATCVGCFGAGYLDCGDDVHCYNPNDPQYDTCPDGSTPTGGSSSSGSSGSSGSGLSSSALTSGFFSSTTSTGSLTSSTSNNFSGSSSSGSSSSDSDSGSSSNVSSDSSSGAGSLDVAVAKVGAAVVGAFGVLVLAL
ncbi:uncharacterized protein HMPREF1541_07841 [Cyphellophora europaea CBS 101466]|uniref:Endo-1,3(4)-beta-glucanase 1 carbohydrate binding domain-containing protein n=1 Tax=Cyphellophora europaea (strain CBS 101466) TaxID=1220924 RepID=W2RM96_CYPE1|nr:uncharacterized protein HMPREF1541_07841 [Cyphellophora europaea CBS 101466]ETN36854.1 hypothetical protein HMPREF1541_07841 [Cyphellophora europaea CBS 101466]